MNSQVPGHSPALNLPPASTDLSAAAISSVRDCVEYLTRATEFPQDGECSLLLPGLTSHDPSLQCTYASNLLRTTLADPRAAHFAYVSIHCHPTLVALRPRDLPQWALAAAVRVRRDAQMRQVAAVISHIEAYIQR